MSFKILLLYIVIVNIIGFALMGIDKRKAKKRVWRIRERTFWMLAVFGAAVGSYIGMKTFNHKTKHHTFIIGMPIIMLINIVLFGYISFSLS